MINSFLQPSYLPIYPQHSGPASYVASPVVLQEDNTWDIRTFLWRLLSKFFYFCWSCVYWNNCVLLGYDLDWFFYRTLFFQVGDFLSRWIMLLDLWMKWITFCCENPNFVRIEFLENNLKSWTWIELVLKALHFIFILILGTIISQKENLRCHRLTNTCLADFIEEIIVRSKNFLFQSVVAYRDNDQFACHHNLN